MKLGARGVEEVAARQKGMGRVQVERGQSPDGGGFPAERRRFNLWV